MPLIDFSTRVGFDSLYRIGAEAKWPHPNTRPEVKLHYCRSVMWASPPFINMTAQYASYYIALGVLPTDTFAIVGAGYGLTVEYLNTVHGYNGVAVDNSPYIQATKDQDDEDEIIEWMTGIITPDDPRWKQILDEHSSKGVRLGKGDGRKSRTTILDESADSTQSRRNITGHFGLTGVTKLDWAISELTLEGATDAEIVEGAGFMHAYAAQVAHTFIPPKPRQMPINFKTVEEWRKLLPDDYLIDGQTGAVDVP